jgi:transposase
MKLYYDKRLKDPTYYAQQGIRIGSKTTTRNVKKFGKHSELLKTHSDPLAYVQGEIQKMNEEYRGGKVEYTVTTDFNERVKPSNDAVSKSTAVNIGYFFLQSVMDGLHLKEFFEKACENRRFTFDCYGISRFLTYDRILDPKSKYATWDCLDRYYEKPSFDYQHILRFLDLLEENHDEYLRWLYDQSTGMVKRDTSCVYYDCTNFYFETEKPDEEYVDEVTGEIMTGLRQYGFSKEHRPNPIVEMGLFMDRDGIPITMCLHPGNTNEQVTAIPLEKELLKMKGQSEFIYCADAGLGSYDIRLFNSLGGRAFVVTQSLKKVSSVVRDAVFNDFEYRLLSDNSPVTIESMKAFDRHAEENLGLYNDFAYKVIPVDKAIDLGLREEKVCKDGKTRMVKSTGLLKQRLIVTFSRKAMEYQRAVRNRQIERAKKLLAKNDPEEIKKGPSDVRRFMKRVTSTKSGETASVSYELDEEKIAAEEKYDGYYAVATNLQGSPKEILGITKNRYQIEDCFRVMKTNLSGRPVNHHDPDRIKAHFLTCYTALLVVRLMERMLDDQGTHVTTGNLIDTLKNLNVANVNDLEYMALYTGSTTLKALTKRFDLDLDRKHYKPKELNRKIKKFLH